MRWSQRQYLLPRRAQTVVPTPRMMIHRVGEFSPRGWETPVAAWPPIQSMTPVQPMSWMMFKPVAA